MSTTLRSMIATFALVIVCLWTPAAFAGGNHVVGSLTRESRVEPGSRSSGRILVHNSSSEVLELEAKQTDYWFNADGTNRYAAPGTEPRSNARWIHISPQQLRVPAGETLAFTYDIDVPADDSLSGSYWSVVMIAPIVQPLQVESRPGERKVSVQANMRYGVQIITEVGPPAPASLAVRDVKLQRNDTGVRMVLDLENTGQRHTKPQVWVEIFDASGASVGRRRADDKRLYPTTSARYTVPLGPLEPGHYSALMVADLGNDEVFGARYDLQIP